MALGDRQIRLDSNGSAVHKMPATAAAYNMPPPQPPSMTARTRSQSSSSGQLLHDQPAPSVTILHEGYLLIKKGMFKGYEKRYYLLTTSSPDLFSFRDDRQYDDWRAAELPLRAINGQTTSNKGPMPTHVCRVLRADRAGDSAAMDRAIAVIAGDQVKCTSMTFLAETAASCEAWIQAFHQVQATRRNGAHAESVISTTHGLSPAAQSVLHRPDDAVLGRQQSIENSRSQRLSDVSDGTSTHSSSQRIVEPTTTGPGNVLLFMPAVGSNMSISDSKLEKAKMDLEQLVAKGAKRPMRTGMENAKNVTWRYGTPDYVLSDLEYIRGKQRDDESTPLETYVETCCQTFLMEAAHKARYTEWSSVRHDYFHVRMNGGEKIPGHAISDRYLFGMMCLRDVRVEGCESYGGKDPCAILGEAFTEGFPMEVLDVYTQPPQCHFSWRHWGRFTGRYKGIKGDGSVVEVRGFGQTHIDAGRMLDLQLFFKPQQLFDRLNAIVERLAKEQGVTLNNGSTNATRPTRQSTVTSYAGRSQRTPSSVLSKGAGSSDRLGDFT